MEFKPSEISPIMDTKEWLGVDYCYFNATPEEYKDVNNSSVIRAIMKSSGKTSFDDFRAIYEDLYSIKEDFDRVNVPMYYLKNFGYTITSFIYHPLTPYVARNDNNEVLSWMRDHQKGNYIICVGDFLQHVFAYIDGTIYDKYVNPFDAISKITTSNQKYIVWVAERIR